jgi:hypothetical protein
MDERRVTTNISNFRLVPKEIRRKLTNFKEQSFPE